MERTGSRTAAVCAVAGSVVLFIGTYLHPMGADPNDPAAAFAEYAADHLWIASHLTQLAGVALIVAALVFLAQQLETRRIVWARIAAAGAIASLAVAAALQAVDGIALKVMVDTWAAAPATEKDIAFRAAFAVRQVEVGLASMLSLSFGLTATIYGGALWADQTYPKWFAALAILGGLSTLAAGIVIAYTGFSDLAMMLNMPANFLLLVWIFVLGGWMWREPRSSPPL